jgi:hypothetical protein
MCAAEEPTHADRTAATESQGAGQPDWPVRVDRIERIERNDAGQLVVHIRGRDEPVVDAGIRRCFPWSLPDSYIAIRSKEGKEIALLLTLDVLDAPSRALVEEELRDRAFNPQILRVIDFKQEFGVTSITAETDRGRVTFQIRSRDDVRALSPTRALFRDVDGNTYEVADLNALDATSRKRLSAYF